jgi:hypothetical protein
MRWQPPMSIPMVYVVSPHKIVLMLSVKAPIPYRGIGRRRCSHATYPFGHEMQASTLIARCMISLLCVFMLRCFVDVEELYLANFTVAAAPSTVL